MEDRRSVGPDYSAQVTVPAGDVDQSQSADSEDGWTWAFIWIWTAVFFSAIIAPFFPNVNVVMPLLLTCFLVMGVSIASIAMFIFLVCMRRWRNLLSMLVGPFPAAFLTYGSLTSPYSPVPYFLLHQATYMEEVKKKSPNENGEVLFEVGVSGLSISSTTLYVVYDPSDRNEAEIGKINMGSAQKLLDHFYYLRTDF